MPDIVPNLPVPPSLRGAETGSFAHHTVARRMPDIARRVLQENDLPEAAEARMQTLIDDLPDAPVRRLTDTASPDAAAWQRYIAAQNGQDWLAVTWFFAETYFYRRIVEAVDFFATGYDPFQYQKHRGLETTLGQIEALAEQLQQALDDPARHREHLIRFLMQALWGNQADLSLWPAGEEGQPLHQDDDTQEAHLLADDTEAVADYLAALGRPALVDVIADNAGFELIGDLCLVDYLLSSGQAASVRLHLKLHPTFVSDALIKDVAATIDYLRHTGTAAVQRLGERLHDHRRAGRLLLAEHPYWTSPLSGWEMPTAVRAILAPADLIISKGDANYRRWLGDRHWTYTLPFDQVVSYFPAPLVALRTIKAEVAAGIPPARVRQLNEEDPDWMTNGHWGLIQFVR